MTPFRNPQLGLFWPQRLFCLAASRAACSPQHRQSPPIPRLPSSAGTLTGTISAAPALRHRPAAPLVFLPRPARAWVVAADLRRALPRHIEQPLVFALPKRPRGGDDIRHLLD